MTEQDDHELLAAHARTESESAFATLVARHVNLVHSAALRFTGNPHHAGEISQAVFILLARKAGSLGRHVIISGWLYQAARLTAANFMKGEIRRQQREQETYLQSTLKEPDHPAWQQIAPLLDEAMGRLGEADRNALVLRYFENKSVAEIGGALKLNEAAAQKRLGRALEKLRKLFARRGVTLSARAIAAAISANSVTAAPAGLAATISTVAVTKGATAAGSTATLVKGALKLMAWTKAKLAIVVGVGVLLAAGTTTLTVEKIQQRQNEAWQLGQNTSKVLLAPPFRTVILPTLAAKRNPLYGSSGMASARDGQLMGYNQSIPDMVRLASSEVGWINQCRTVLATEVSTNKYDFLSNLPVGARPALQRALQKKFSLAGRLETRETNALLLKVKYPDAAALRPSVPQFGFSSSGNGQITDTKASSDDLAQILESTLQIPVLNQTGLTNRYDFKIHWPQSYQPGSQPANDAALKQALQDQLGLELVPGTALVEMLVIEKVK